jgi:hypothetical protein
MRFASNSRRESVLLTLLLTACAASSARMSATSPIPPSSDLTVESAECYSLTYSNPVGAASARLFPTWLMLLPGANAGDVIGRHSPEMDEPSWAGLTKFSGWKRISGDSLEILFTGSFEGIKIHVARPGAILGGRAIWLTDLVGFPEASMTVSGKREQCPQ